MRNLKRALSLAVASVMLFGMMVVGSSAASYPDVDVADNLEAIEVLKAVGIMKGDEKGNFNPDKMVTRNEMAAVMVNLLGLTPGGSSPFYDVPEWAKGYVAACYNNGIIAGVSETQFNGDANVTAVQAGLMVMKALGYFGYQGEFGDSWKLAVVKQADQIDLYRDVNAYTDQDMDRNDVAQMVLNALQCTVTVVREQGGLNVEGNGITVNQKPTYSKIPAENRDNWDYDVSTGIGTDQWDTLQLCEKLYGKELIKNGGDHDDLQRNATKWTYRASTVKTANEPTLTYVNKEVKLKDIYADLGKPTNAWLQDSATGGTSASHNNSISIDGDNGQPANGQSLIGPTATNVFEHATYKDYKVGYPGATTYVYLDRSSGEVNIAVVNNYLAEVSKVSEDDGKYTVTLSVKTRIGSTMSDRDIEVETDTFAKGDVVIYTASNSTNEIQSITKLESVTGTIDGVKYDSGVGSTVTSGDYFKLDGTQYNLGVKGYYDLNEPDNKANINPNDEVTAYVLDGVVYAVDDVNPTKDFLFVESVINGLDGVQAKVCFADGTEERINITKVTFNDTTVLKPSDNSLTDSGLKGKMETGSTGAGYVFSYSEDNGDYELTEAGLNRFTLATSTSAGDCKIEKGKATVKMGATGSGVEASVTTDNSTVFVDVGNNKTYVGYKNVPSFERSTTNGTRLHAAYKNSSDKVADVIFIQSGDGTNEDELIFYVEDNAFYRFKSGNTWYRTYTAWVDGEKQDVTIKEDVAITASIAENTIYVSKNVNDSGYITTLANTTNRSATVTADFAKTDNKDGNVEALGTDVITIQASSDLKTVDNYSLYDESGSETKTTFLYNEDTKWIVVTGNTAGTDTDTVEMVGDSGAVVKYDDGDGTSVCESRVYIVAVDDKSDDDPLATVILVVNPQK